VPLCVGKSQNYWQRKGKVAPVHAFKAYVGRDPLILNLGTRQRRDVNFTTRLSSEKR